MTLEHLLLEQHAPLTRRLRRIVGCPETAEDLRQEAYERALRFAPRHERPERQRAWLHRTATNLALDELRRRRRRESIGLDEALGALEGWAAVGPDGEGGEAAREALAGLRPQERGLLLGRFGAGLSYVELGHGLGLPAPTVRKRVERARRAFAEALQAARGEAAPVVGLLGARRAQDGGDYVGWLRRSGAEVRALEPAEAAGALVGVDGLVVAGSHDDVHPGSYGQRVAATVRRPDRRRDRLELAALREALALDLPVVGICRGGQLLNVLFGGTLVQDLPRAARVGVDHRAGEHRIETAAGSVARSVLGARIGVPSEHHQAIDRLGPGLRVASHSPDGVIESLELPGRRLAVGLQWHPERRSEAGDRVGRALVAAATAAR